MSKKEISILLLKYKLRTHTQTLIRIFGEQYVLSKRHNHTIPVQHPVYHRISFVWQFRRKIKRKGKIASPQTNPKQRLILKWKQRERGGGGVESERERVNRTRRTNEMKIVGLL